MSQPKLTDLLFKSSNWSRFKGIPITSPCSYVFLYESGRKHDPGLNSTSRPPEPHHWLGDDPWVTDPKSRPSFILFLVPGQGLDPTGLELEGRKLILHYKCMLTKTPCLTQDGLSTLSDKDTTNIKFPKPYLSILILRTCFGKFHNIRK